jgi:biotin operon repressor
LTKISDFLSYGEGQAVSLDDLSRSTGLPERAVKAEVLQARLKGDLILSSERGYFLPADLDEIRQFVCSRKSYLKTAHAALKPFIKAIKDA